MADPIKRKKLYSYLSENKMTDLSLDDFSNEYSGNNEKFAKLYSYLSENKMTDLNESDFKSEYFGDLVKKKETTQSESTSKDSQVASAKQTQDGALQSPTQDSFNVKTQEKITNDYSTNTFDINQEKQPVVKNSNDFNSWKKNLEDKYGKEFIAEVSDAKYTRKEDLSWTDAKKSVDNITKKYLSGDKIPNPSELKKDADKTISDLIKNDKYIQKTVIPNIVNSKSKILKNKQLEISNKYKLNSPETSQEQLDKANKEYTDFANSLINDEINKNTEINDRLSKYSNFVDKDFQQKYKDYRRNKELPEWVTKSGTIVEALYNTIVNDFGEKVPTSLGVMGTSSQIQDIDSKLKHLNDRISNGTLKKDDEIGFALGGNYDRRKPLEVLNALNNDKAKIQVNLVNKLEDIKGIEDKMSIFKSSEIFDEDGLTLGDLGTMIGSQIPQMGVALLTYGIGNSIQETSSSYIDNLNGIASEKFKTETPSINQLVDVINSGEDEKGVAVATGLAVGALERIGAGGQVKALMANKKIVGSLLRGEFKSLAKKGTFTTVESLKSGLGEFMTEGVQTLTSQLSKSHVTKQNQINLKEISESSAQGGFIGFLFPFAGHVSKQTITETRNSVRIVASKFNSEHLEKYYNSAKINLDNKLQSKEITLQEYKSTIEDLNSVRNASSKVPSELTAKQKNIAIELLVEKQGLEKKIEGKESSLVEAENNRIKEINLELKNVKNIEDPISNIKITSTDGTTSVTDENFDAFIGDDANVQDIIDGNVNIEINNEPKKAKQLEDRIAEIKKKTASNVSEQTNEFAEGLGETTDISDTVAGATMVKIGDTELILNDNGANIVIESIRTDEAKKGQGSAKNTLTKVTELADEQGKTVELKVVPENEKTTKEGLEKLYEGFGFVKDGDKMVRAPKKEDVFTNIDAIIDETPNEVTEKDQIDKVLPKQTKEVETEKGEKQLTAETKTDKKGRILTYFESTTEKDGNKKTTYTFNRSDKSTDQRNPVGVSVEVALTEKRFEVDKTYIPEGTTVTKVFEVREGETTTGATVEFTTEEGDKFRGEVKLNKKSETKPTENEVEEKVAEIEAVKKEEEDKIEQIEVKRKNDLDKVQDITTTENTTTVSETAIKEAISLFGAEDLADLQQYIKDDGVASVIKHLEERRLPQYNDTQFSSLREAGVKKVINAVAGNNTSESITKTTKNTKEIDKINAKYDAEIEKVKSEKVEVAPINKTNETKKNGDIVTDGNIQSKPRVISSKGKDKPVSKTKNVRRGRKNVTTDKTVEFKTNQNDYNVEVKNGELKITPKYGKSKPSKAEVKKVTEQYIKQTDFDKGKRADVSKANSDEQISQVIAEESQNAQEVAQQIKTVRDAINEKGNVTENTKEMAIANALNGVQVNKESFASVDDVNNISSVNKYYFEATNKKQRGKQGNIDNIRENAQQNTNETVTLEDIANFMKEHRSPTQFIKQANQKSNTDLELKFEELTGLKSTPKNIDAVIGDVESKQNQEQESDLTKEELEVLNNEQEILVKEYDNFFNALDENTQNEILEDYENKSTEISEDTKRGESKESVIDEKEETTSKKIDLSESLNINDFLANLDNISNELDKFGKETLGINLPVAVAKVAVGAMKVAGKTAKTTADVISAGLNAVKETDWYKNLSKTDKEDINKNLAKRISEPLTKEPETEPKVEIKEDIGGQDFNKEPGKKSIFKRIYDGDTNEKLKDNVEKYGLDFQIESQEKAQKAARKFVNEVGINKALEALRGNIIKGAEKAFVYAEVLDALLEVSENTTPSELSKIQEDYSTILEESMVAFDQEARDAGRFISALNKVYNTSKIKYSLTRQVNDYKANNHGFIDEDTLTKFKEADANIKRLEAEMEVLIKQQAIERGNEAIESINEDIERNKENEKKKRSYAKTAKIIAKNIRKAKIHRPNMFSAATPVSLIWDGAVETVAKSVEVGGSLADSIQKGVDFIKKTEWYGKLSKLNQVKAIQEFQNEINNSSEQKEITLSDNGEIKIPEQIIRDLVESGISDINELSNAVLNIIKENNPDSDLTLREVRDAITKYGKVINPSKDEVKQKIAELKRTGRLISGLEDVIDGKRPKRSGFQRAKPTQTERELTREINDKMRDLPLDETDLQNAWKNALEKTKTRLQNQIEDLEKQIVNKEKSKVKRQSIKLDNEAQELKENRDELRKLLNELVGKPEATEEQKIKKAVRNLEISIEKLTNQIADKNIEFKEKPEKVTSNEIERLHNVKYKLQIELKKLREESGIVEKRRLKQAKTRLQNQIEEYQLRLLENDFSRKERKELKSDKELKELRREKIKWQEVFEQERYALEIKNRSLAEYVRELIVGLLNIPRILMAGGEMSMVFIQGGIQTISLATRNPKALANTFAKAFVAIGSQRRMDEYAGTLKADTSYDLMKQSGLALTQADYKMELREEEFIGNNLVYGLWNLIGKGLEYGSIKVFKIKDVASIGSSLFSLINKDVKINKIPLSERFKNANPLLALERGNTVYMNELRRLRFEDGMKMLQMEGKNEDDFMADYKKLASAINTMTGRANIGRLERVNDIIGSIFFSFKNTVSVFNQLYPYFYTSLHSPNDPITKASVAQKLAMRDMFSFVTITTSMMFLLQAAAGSDDDEEPIIYIETDPRSSDFMQLKIKGKEKYIRFDPWHGMRPQVVFLAKLTQGEQKNSKGKIVRIGKGYKNDTQWDNFTRTYIENKFSPSAGMVFKYLDSEIKEVDGEDIRMRYGEPLSESYKENFYPMYINAIAEIENEDPELITRFLMATSFFGVNSSVYGDVKK